jgi:hypothetical protein
MRNGTPGSSATAQRLQDRDRRGEIHPIMDWEDHYDYNRGTYLQPPRKVKDALAAQIANRVHGRIV